MQSSEPTEISSELDASVDQSAPSPAQPEKKMAQDYLQEWKNVCFFEDQLTMTQAADSLLNDGEPLVEARPVASNKMSTWTLFNSTTKKEAILVHAGIWSWNADLDTGNFVPKGEKVPSRVTEKRVQRVPGFKCDVSHVIDTVLDDSIWTNMEIFENYVKNLEDFNQSQRDRSSWQDGSYRSSYIISSKLFVRKSTKPRAPDFEPHEWLDKGVADQKSKEFVVNPNKPRYYDFVNGKLVKLENSVPAYYKKGDIIWFSFKLSFFIGRESWAPELVPLEFVRIALGEGLYTETVDDVVTEEKEDSAEYLPAQRLEEGQKLVVISRKQPESDNDSTSSKRKSEDLSDIDTMTSSSASGDGQGNGTENTEDFVDVSAEAEVDIPTKKRLRRSRA